MLGLLERFSDEFACLRLPKSTPDLVLPGTVGAISSVLSDGSYSNVEDSQKKVKAEEVAGPW